MIAINEASDRLQRIYDLHERFCADLTLACRKGCAPCCTANVTLTTLEATAIRRHWEACGQTMPLERLQRAAGRPRFQPVMTTNQFAAICAGGGEPPDEAADPQVDACPLLENDICTVYTARPFGCRAMVSRTDCARHGAADMPDRVLAANTLFMQFIEALDHHGMSGNLIDVLLWLNRSGDVDNRAPNPSGGPPAGLTPNRPIPVLMVPPEYREALQPLLRALRPLLTPPAL